jgi:hypothetical protein
MLRLPQRICSATLKPLSPGIQVQNDDLRLKLLDSHQRTWSITGRRHHVPLTFQK